MRFMYIFCKSHLCTKFENEADLSHTLLVLQLCFEELFLIDDRKFNQDHFPAQFFVMFDITPSGFTKKFEIMHYSSNLLSTSILIIFRVLQPCFLDNI